VQIELLLHKCVPYYSFCCLFLHFLFILSSQLWMEKIVIHAKLSNNIDSALEVNDDKTCFCTTTANTLTNLCHGIQFLLADFLCWMSWTGLRPRSGSLPQYI
jgi:hypothetical protein